jgi:uncharacterized small protein (DUF1192 family)
MHSHLVADRSNYWSNIIQDTWQWYEAAMDTDELEPPKIPVGKPDLELLSIAQLEDCIVELEAEIARIRSAIAGKQSARGAADAVFKI